MNFRSKLEGTKFPQMLAELRHANQFLKVYAVGATILTMLSLCLCFINLGQDSKVIVLSTSGSRIAIDERPDPNTQVTTALSEYIKFRYTWDSKSIKQQLAAAKNFVRSSALKSFEANMVEVEKFAAERNVTQRGYAASIDVDFRKQSATVRGDRVTSIEGLSAAGQLNLVLEFESGPRTQANPWGVYVVRERNE